MSNFVCKTCGLPLKVTFFKRGRRLRQERYVHVGVPGRKSCGRAPVPKRHEPQEPSLPALAYVPGFGVVKVLTGTQEAELRKKELAHGTPLHTMPFFGLWGNKS